MVFIDTNVWVYALSAQDHAKKEVAVDLIAKSYRDDMICVSSQVNGHLLFRMILRT